MLRMKNYIVAALILLFVHYSEAQQGCQWTQYLNTLIYGGNGISSANTLDACQSVCQSTTGCVSIDWAPGNAGAKCFLFSKKTDKVPNIQGVTHYDYDCPNTGCQWQYYYNTNIYGGQGNGATTLAACQAACIATAGCVSIDYSRTNPTGQQCFLLQKQTDKNNNINGVDHYDLTGSCGTSCQWYRYPNSNIYGGTINPASTVSACQSACTATSGCVSIDWSATNQPGSQCFLLQTQNGRNSYISNVDHYDYVCNATSGYSSTTLPGTQFSSTAVISSTVGVQCFQRTPNTLIYGGTQNPAPTLSQCQSACLALPSSQCASIDWDNTRPAGSQCFLLNTQQNKIPTNGVDHYDRFC